MPGESKGIKHLKQKISNICTAEKFCGICLEISEKLCTLDAEFDIIVDQASHKHLMKDVIGYILNDVAHQVLASSYVCMQCTEKAIQSYIFIYNTKQLSKTIYKCVSELYSKTVDVQNQLSEISTDENSNIVIVLEQEQETESQYIEVGNVIEIIDPNNDAINNFTESESDPNLLSIIESVKDKKVIVEPVQPFIDNISSNTDEKELPNIKEIPNKECAELKDKALTEKYSKLIEKALTKACSKSKEKALSVESSKIKEKVFTEECSKIIEKKLTEEVSKLKVKKLSEDFSKLKEKTLIERAVTEESSKRKETSASLIQELKEKILMEECSNLKEKTITNERSELKEKIHNEEWPKLNKEALTEDCSKIKEKTHTEKCSKTKQKSLIEECSQLLKEKILTQEYLKQKGKVVEEKLVKLFGVESSGSKNANEPEPEVIEIDDDDNINMNYSIEIMVVDESFDCTALDKTDLADDKENKNAVLPSIETVSLESPEINNSQVLSPETKKMNVEFPPTFKCKICREILPSQKGWRKHLKICRKKRGKIKLKSRKIPLNCKICNEVFLTQGKLNTHYKTHSRVRCKVCQFIIPTEDLAEHMRINHDDYTHLCKLCDFFSFNAAGLENHMAKNHIGSKCAFCHKQVSETAMKTHRCRFNCSECLENVCIHYKYLVSYKDQVLKNGSKVTKCADCDYVSNRREVLLGHVNREHLDHHPFTCAHCSQQFYSRTSLRLHLIHFHMEKHVCEFCDLEFNSLPLLNDHKEMCINIERHHKCDFCTSSFTTLEELADHVKLRHEKDCFNCNLCNRQFLSATKLQDHTFRVHSGLQMKRKRAGSDCPICDVKYKTKKELLEHITIHGPGSRFPCKHCEEDFDSIQKLHTHKRVHYDDVIQCLECKKVLTSTFFPHHMVYCKPGRQDNKVFYPCELCGKIYKSDLQLKAHLKTHVDKKPCPICQKPTKPIYLKTHIRIAHSKPKKKKEPKIKIKHKYVFQCPLCPHKVSRNGEMEAHMNRHHLHLKPYKCDVCNKSFFGKDRLRVHKVTHTSDKTCLCSICNRMFQNNACLKLHMRKHTGDLPYACEICGDRFRTSSIMNTHKIKRHSVKTICCPLCDTMFHLKREMRGHFKKRHWKQKDKKFDPRDVEELDPAFYHLFEDGRLPKVDGESLCLASKCNEKVSK